MAKQITVRVDPFLLGIIPRYLDTCRRHIQAIRGHMEQRNFAEIQLIGHGLKGSGGSFGLNEISRFGKSIEETARNGETDAVAAWVKKFEDYLNALHVEPRAH